MASSEALTKERKRVELAGTGAVRGPSVMVVAAGATRRMPEAAGKRRKLGVVFVSCEAVEEGVGRERA